MGELWEIYFENDGILKSEKKFNGLLGDSGILNN